jgi:hypothetical protein
MFLAHARKVRAAGREHCRTSKRLPRLLPSVVLEQQITVLDRVRIGSPSVLTLPEILVAIGSKTAKRIPQRWRKYAQPESM